MKRVVFVAVMAFMTVSLFAFDEGFVLGLKAYFSGSATDPHISDGERKKMGADFLKGGVGFIMHGEFDLTYIFDSKKYFKYENNKIFGGLGFGGYVGIGQGYSGQHSGQGNVNVFVNVFFTPVVHFGASLKTYLISNRLILGFSVGGRLIADPTPMYDAYSDKPLGSGGKPLSEVGTIIVTDDMMKKMNPWGAEFKGSIEYIQPILPTTELVLGGFIGYCIYKPGYISMPPTLEEAAMAAGFDAKNTKLNSFYLNSFDFGISVGINFKVNP